MKVNNKKMCLIFVLVILEISSLFLMYKSNSNKEIKLDNVENKEVINNNIIAIMIEQSNGTYSQYTTNNNWPSDTTYVLNPLKSGCVDNDGNKIKDGMTFDKTNRKIILNTNKTSNCYAYFTRSVLYKIQNNSHVWNSDLASDGYRFYGSQDKTLATVDNVPNYVCFGTQSKSECVSDTDKYMYRIIGIFQEETTSGGYNIVNTSSDYHLKLIKKEALNTAYQWHSNEQINTSWSASDLYKGINSDYFVNNLDYPYMQDNYWYSKITNWKWNATNNRPDSTGGLNYGRITASNVYLDEMNRSIRSSESVSVYDTPIAKIGLMYASDYMLSLGSAAKEYKGSNSSSLLSGWLHMKNNDSNALTGMNPPKNDENIISRYGYYSDSVYSVYCVRYDGQLFYVGSNIYMSVRPVFYLNSDIVICSGSGTISDPYILG